MRDDDFSDTRMLFDTLREIGGEDAITLLCSKLGGKHIIIPCKHPTERSPFVRAMGWDIASSVIARYRVIGADGFIAAGFRVYVRRIDDRAIAARRRTALHAGSIRAERSNKIRRDAVYAMLNGMTKHEAALKFGLNPRTLSRGVRQEILNGTLTVMERARVYPRAPPLRMGASDAALIAAHNLDPTATGMAARLGISLGGLRNRLRRTRARTGLPLDLGRTNEQKAFPPDHQTHPAPSP